tara:strand:- start:279 stop:614 length:336 start_codon:yes stop_codon:yes gene_type:complete
MDDTVYNVTSVSYFHEEDYKEIKPSANPLQKTSVQVKLIPTHLTNRYYELKINKKIEKWYKDYHVEINYLFKKCIRTIKDRQIIIHTPLHLIYNDFVYMLYYKFMNNYIKN